MRTDTARATGGARTRLARSVSTLTRSGSGLAGSKLAVKVARYAIGSAAALLTSVAVFALLLDLGVGTTADSIVAFVAGALPNWILNRRWAWERSGEVDFGREVVGYALISLISLGASSAATGGVDALLRRGLAHEQALRVLLVTLTYVTVQGLLFVAKFVAYDTLVFTVTNRRRQVLETRPVAVLLAPELESDAAA